MPLTDSVVFVCEDSRRYLVEKLAASRPQIGGDHKRNRAGRVSRKTGRADERFSANPLWRGGPHGAREGALDSDRRIRSVQPESSHTPNCASWVADR